RRPAVREALDIELTGEVVAHRLLVTAAPGVTGIRVVVVVRIRRFVRDRGIVVGRRVLGEGRGGKEKRPHGGAPGCALRTPIDRWIVTPPFGSTPRSGRCHPRRTRPAPNRALSSRG